MVHSLNVLLNYLLQHQLNSTELIKHFYKLIFIYTVCGYNETHKIYLYFTSDGQKLTKKLITNSLINLF